ncbi:Charged multivesicular body protein 1 [Hondaea fermentalgiana]|uniref:Charged multivesicular body protein 1 n=1 Tax=Hondaea fermentalgiana TaxID=2315210 RepID=A0A2R5GJZ6_9STRA|nr:Charged multivesicular body protein 1 [Hondaea fermentalgiana]|eukprot:GBG28184.1 Charged multivesicular body protein 1 [Hondaea fermentalgiana]
MGNGESAMQKQLLELRLTAKQLQREAKKCEKNSKAAKAKLKAAIERGDMEGAKIYASNSIRDKNQSLNYLRLASRIEAVSQRVQTAISMGRLSKTMTKTVAGMDKTLKSMDVEKIGKVMDKFEANFEDLDVRSAYMTEAMDSTTAGVTPESEVSELIQMVADEHGLQVAGDLDDAGVVSTKTPAAKETEGASDLEARLAALNSNP